MKPAFPFLFALALTLSGACQATPEPPPTEDPAQEVSAPLIKPKVGGPCTYENTSITATVLGVSEDSVELDDPDMRAFTLPFSVFSEAPRIGDLVGVTRRKITTGTCVPVMYFFAGPVIPGPDSPAEAD